MGINYSLVNYTKKEIIRYSNDRQPYLNNNDSQLTCLYLLINQGDEIKMFELPFYDNKSRKTEEFKEYKKVSFDYRKFKNVTKKYQKELVERG